jgi:hypothetical protein
VAVVGAGLGVAGVVEAEGGFGGVEGEEEGEECGGEGGGGEWGWPEEE